MAIWNRQIGNSMLEQKIRLKQSIERREPPHRVEQFWIEYQEAYGRLHKPSEHHIRDYHELMEKYTKYKETQNGNNR